MVANQPLTRFTLWGQAIAGILVLAIPSAIVAGTTDVRLVVVFPILAAGAVLCCALALYWLARWAKLKDGRLGQFGIGSLLLLTLYASLFFSGVRWLVLSSPWTPTKQVEPGDFIAVSIVCLIGIGMLAPFVLRLTESLLWAGVWIVRRPTLQRWLHRRRGS